MTFTATELELFMRILLVRLGGEAVLSTSDADMQAIDHYTLFAESVQGDDTAIKFSVVQIDFSQAGHA